MSRIFAGNPNVPAPPAPEPEPVDEWQVKMLAALDQLAAAVLDRHLSADAQTVTLASTQIDPAGGSTGRASKTVTNTVNAATSVLSCTSASFTQADVSWAINKMGVGNVSTDPGTTTAGAISGIWDIIGGTGGASPFNQAFSADYTGSTSFTLNPVITVTASNT